MNVIDLLRRIAAARGGTAVVILELPDGSEIACTSEAQARSIETLWRSLTNKAYAAPAETDP